MPARSALQRRRPGPRRCRGGYPAGGRGRDPDAERLRRPARSGAGVRVKIGPGHCLRQTPGALSPPSRLARFTNSQFQRTAAPRCAAIMACDLSLCRARKWAQLCTQRQGRFRRINPTAAAPRWSQRNRFSSDVGCAGHKMFGEALQAFEAPCMNRQSMRKIIATEGALLLCKNRDWVRASNGESRIFYYQ